MPTRSSDDRVRRDDRYVLTVRLGGVWKWTAILAASPEGAIEAAERYILDPERDPIWRTGGLVLASGNEVILNLPVHPQGRTSL